MNLVSIVIALAAGGLIGVMMPLPRSGETGDVRSPAVATRQTVSTRNATPAEVLEVPKEVTIDWAVACATSSPDAFFHWLLGADPQPSREIVEAFFSAWIDQDADSAFEAALSLPTRFGYDTESQFFVRELVRVFMRDPVCALRWTPRIEGVLGAAHVRTPKPRMFQDPGAPSPEEVRALLDRGRMGDMSAAMANAYASYLASRDLEGAIRWGESLNVEHQNAVLPMLLYALSQKDPVRASEYVTNAPSNIKQYGALFALGYGSASSIAEQMEWLAEEMGTTSYTGNNNLMWKLFAKDPKVAEDYVISLGETTQGIEAVRGLAEAACYSGSTEKAVAMIVTLPDALRLEAAHAAMTIRMPGDFAAFLQPLNNGSLRGANLDRYIQQVAAFVDGGPSGRPWKVSEVPEHLAKFQDWLRDNPGPGRDRFIVEVSEVLKDNPDLKNKVFEKLPTDELARILRAEGQR